VQKIIRNTSTMNRSHSTQILRDKRERREIEFYWIPEHCGVEVKEREVQIVN
jgi:hypothetical protein